MPYESIGAKGKHVVCRSPLNYLTDYISIDALNILSIVVEGVKFLGGT